MKNSLNLNEEKLDAFGNAIVHYNIEKQLRLKYDKLLAEHKNNNKETVLFLSSFVKIAAVAIAILGSIFLMQVLNNSPSIQITAQNFLDNTKIHSNPDITRKGSNMASTIRREANDAFALKNFPLAISKYEALKAQSKISSLDQFYLGISYLKTNNYSVAIEILSQIRDLEKIETAEIDWLLSLAYILSNQELKAIPMLQKIKKDNRYKAKEAGKLLDAFDR